MVRKFAHQLELSIYNDDISSWQEPPHVHDKIHHMYMTRSRHGTWPDHHMPHVMTNDIYKCIILFGKQRFAF